MAKTQADIREKLLSMIKNALSDDREQREKLAIGDKFKFIQQKLQQLLEQVEQTVVTLQAEEAAGFSGGLTANEVLVYVHLFNAQGLTISAWKNMVKPDVLYEYSVNRPIYSNKAEIDAFIAGRPKREQHAYLAIAIDKNDIVTGGDEKKDPSGNTLTRIKEGSLKHQRIQGFVHQGHDYHVTAQSKLVRKES